MTRLGSILSIDCIDVVQCKTARLLVALFDRYNNSVSRIVEEFDLKFAFRSQIITEIIIVVDVNTPILTINTCNHYYYNY